MDLNTMLSAAYDAYEKVKLELTAAQQTIEELRGELDAIKKDTTNTTEAKPTTDGPGEAD